MRILVVEDDKKVAQFLIKGLKESGFSVDLATTGDNGLYYALNEEYDIIILDIMLPGLSGDRILQTLRDEGHHTPVIFLTAKDSPEDIVTGLNIGADDYMVKPFSFSELIARIRAILRRGKDFGVPIISAADLTLDQVSRRVERGGTPIDLTVKEYALLEYFMLNQGQVLTRTMISEHVWNYDFDPMTNIIDVHVSHLRSKIDKNFSPKLIHTVKGVGYVLKEEG